MWYKRGLRRHLLWKCLRQDVLTLVTGLTEEVELGMLSCYCGELCLGRGEADRFWGVLWLQVGYQLPYSSTKLKGVGQALCFCRFYFLAWVGLECVCSQFPHLPCCNVAPQALVALLVLTFRKVLLAHTAVVHDFC